MVDKFWGALTWDFLGLGLNVMDWVAGLRDWREFYRIKEHLGQGTHYHSALINDPEVAEALAGLPENKNDAPPAAEGWTPLMERLASMEDRITMLHAATVGAKGHQVVLVPRPVYEFETIRSRRGKLKSRIMQSQLLPGDNIIIPEDIY